MYDFDKVIDRHNTGCAKWDRAYKDDEKMISMWVADMDFQTLPEIREALSERALNGIYGYGLVEDDYYNAVIKWMDRRHDFHIEKEWIVPTPGIVTAIRLCVQAYTKENDHVLIMRPVYYPFDKTILDSSRQLVTCPLVYKDYEYTIDFDLFEQKIVDNDVKMFILCSPHNPIGRVWKKEELQKLGDICKKHNVIVVSDEIHMDFVYGDNKFISFYEVDPSFKDFSVVATAASKTFNLAGLQCSNIIIQNKDLRDKYTKTMNRNGVTVPNIFGLLATQVAYEKGDQWVDEVVEYIHQNFIYLDTFLKENLPEAKLVNPEGLYLAWVDMHAYFKTPQKQEKFMLEKAHLWLDEGSLFGEEGDLFERFNLACPRSTLENALHQIKEAFNQE